MRHRVDATWVFGYGSLVAPESVARTIGRVIEHPDERAVTHLRGYGRRWNYGSQLLRGNWTIDGRLVREGLVVSLGLVPSHDEWCNGVSICVEDDELAALDARESDYEMTDITDAAVVDDEPIAGRIVTFVPRPSAVDRYRRARDAGRAAIRSTYVELVERSFDDLGGDHRRLYDRTPAPDVPVADVELVWPDTTPSPRLIPRR